jgi:hypothetical protein
MTQDATASLGWRHRSPAHGLYRPRTTRGGSKSLGTLMIYLLRRYGLPGVLVMVVLAAIMWGFAHLTAAPCSEVKMFWGGVSYTKQGEGCREIGGRTATSKSGESNKSNSGEASDATKSPRPPVPIEVQHGIASHGGDTVLRRIRGERRLRELATMESGRGVQQITQQTYFFVEIVLVCAAATSKDEFLASFVRAQALRFQLLNQSIEVHFQNGASGHLLEVFASEESGARVAQLNGDRVLEISVSGQPFQGISSLISLPVGRVVGCTSRYIQMSPREQVLIYDLLVR